VRVIILTHYGNAELALSSQPIDWRRAIYDDE
jgi:hypothetical protein